MKKTLITLNLIVLAALFSAGGFYLGSRGEKVEVLLPPLARNERGETRDPAQEVRTEDAIPSSNTERAAATAPQIPAADPQPAQAPEPQTSVS